MLQESQVQLSPPPSTPLNQDQRMPAYEHLLMEPLTGYDPEVARLLWALEDTRGRTMDSLADLSPELVDWTPPEGGNSIGTLLYHLAAIEMDWLFTDILERPFTPEVEALLQLNVRDDQGNLTQVVGMPLGTHLQRLETARAILLDALRGLTGQELRRARHMKGYLVTPEWVFHHLMQHKAEHRGQIQALRTAARAHGSAR